MQRNFVAKYLGNAEKDAALAAFYEDGSPDWRFSFIKMEYSLKEGSSGKVNVERELTPAKRYSFLVGKNEPNYTCKKQFLELVMTEETMPLIDDIETAFTIEKVTKDFFNEYKELYIELKESLDKIIENDPHVKKEFEDNDISSIDFCKKLLGQIVFIYFLQKKGWLGVRRLERGEFQPWGSGSKNFLRRLFNKYIVSYDNFFNDILEPLFYEALATQRDDDYYSRFNCKIPFLNGGLFEPINDYDWVATDILLDNAIFQKILETFDRYNFTIKEDEPLEKEVAIDPEMLGKVFENLLEIKDRRSTGSYYTPREIVHYMCQQSLINYLETNIDIPHEDIENFIRFGEFTNSEDERHLIQIKEINEQIARFPYRANELRKELIKHINSLTLPKSIIENRKMIDSLLKNVKIADPAVGSGAFPVGMMTLIVKARSVLTPFFPEEDRKGRTDYNLKRETIENCLYGVDIDSSAVDIAKLRFWLSLIVDELDMKNIKPLPNLDHKIMVGNSLLEEFEGVKLFDEQLLGEPVKTNNIETEQIDKKIEKLYRELGEIHKGLRKAKNDRIKEIQKELKQLEKKKKELASRTNENGQQVTLLDTLQQRIKQSRIKLNELKKLQKLFFNEQNRELKRRYTDDIDKLEWELIEETLKEQGNEEAMKKLRQYKKFHSKPFFLWKLYFAEVFQRENPGFDIVIANPPYVRQEEIKEYKESLKRNYQVFTSTADLYTYFYERGIKILREQATLTFISSNKFMRAKYGIHLRNFLKHNTSIREIIDFGEKHMFEAITNTAVIITKRGHREHNEVTFSDNIIKEKTSSLDQDNLDESAWTLAEPDILELKTKIEKKGILLKNWDLEINRGLLTGFNEAFVIDTKTKEKLCKEDSKNKEIIKPIIRGRDIGKYSYRWNGLWIINTHNGYKLHGSRTKHISPVDVKKDYPAIYEFLNEINKRTGGQVEKREDQGNHWTNLRNCAFLEDFKKEKIIWIELTDKNKFSYSTEEEYVLAGAFLMTGGSLKYLLAFLNSTICKFYFKLICNSSGMGTVQWKKFAMEKIPIPKLNREQQQPFVKLVDQILAITKDKDYPKTLEKQTKVKKLEKEIDQLIYKLYALTAEKIKMVEDEK